MNHTKTPWKVFYAKKNGNIILGIGEAKNAQGITDSRFQMWGDDSEAKANAEFIVRAVNNHEGLLGCLKKLLSSEDQGHYEDCPINYHEEDEPEYICDCGQEKIYEECRQAIENAEAKDGD